MKVLNLTISLFFLITSCTNAYEATTCIPQNSLRVPVGVVSGGISKEQFDAVMDSVQSIYGPIITEHGGSLEIDRNWDDDTVNAYAYRDGDVWHIAMFGGLARHQETTSDAMTLVACHELGHHLGGLPKMSWAANEGEADYFGALKCLRKVWANDDNLSIVSKLEVDPVEAKKCQDQFKNAADVALCERSNMAGLSLGRLLGQLGGTGDPQFSTPDTTVVSKTIDSHPNAQCRLDTYYAASVCTVSANVDVSDDDPDTGVCSRKQNQEVGARPLCWYAEPVSIYSAQIF